jgi:hypothetical protein
MKRRIKMKRRKRSTRKSKSKIKIPWTSIPLNIAEGPCESLWACKEDSTWEYEKSAPTN